jgi:hypothetical protein
MTATGSCEVFGRSDMIFLYFGPNSGIVAVVFALHAGRKYTTETTLAG